MKSSGESKHRPHADRGKSWKDYHPLLVLLAVMLLAATARNLTAFHFGQETRWMHDFMGFFLVIFSMFKFFDLPGFADGFQMYDLLARRVRLYAYIYPFIELFLGLAYLSEWKLEITYVVAICVMVFGAIGVLWALQKKLNVHCACMGNILKVPLSTVALAEDLGMAAMAGVMLALK
jgi:hypothetical protein